MAHELEQGVYPGARSSEKKGKPRDENGGVNMAVQQAEEDDAVETPSLLL